MIKNRFFKTTSGVAFEFAVCKDATGVSVTADNTTTFTTVLGSAQATGDFYLLRQNPTTGEITAAKNDAAAAVFRTGAYKGWPHQLAWCVDGTSKQFYMTAPIIPEKCEPIEKISYAAATAQVSTLTTSGIPVNAIQELYFKIIETTPGNIPLPIWDYNQNLNTATSEATAWANIATKINLGKEGEFFTATAGPTGITITANAGSESRTFKLVFALQPTKSDPNDYGVTSTVSTGTPAYPGNGTQEMVEALYQEALVRQGVGHFYTPAGVTAQEFGIPATLEVALGGTNTFHIYKITAYKSEASKTPHNVLQGKNYIFVAVIAAQATEFERLFGGASYNA